jgi:hypothetical protein
MAWHDLFQLVIQVERKAFWSLSEPIQETKYATRTGRER